MSVELFPSLWQSPQGVGHFGEHSGLPCERCRARQYLNTAFGFKPKRSAPGMSVRGRCHGFHMSEKLTAFDHREFLKSAEEESKKAKQ